MHKMVKTIKKCIPVILLILTSIIIITYDIKKLKYIVMLTVLQQIYFIIKYRDKKYVAIFIVFLSSYYIPILQQYFLGKLLTPHYLNFLGTSDEKVVFLYCLFSWIILSSMNINEDKINNIYIVDKVRKYDNQLIVMCIYFLIILFIIFGHTGGMAIGVYGANGTSSNSLNEYIIILFYIGYIYSGKRKFNNIILFILFGFYVLINIIYGDRIGVLQCGILFYILFFDKKLNFKSVVVAIIVVNVILGGIAGLRNGSIINQINQNKNIIIQVENNIINNNQSQVFNSSVCIVKLVDDNILDTRKRFISLQKMTERLILSNKYAEELGNLSIYCQKYFPAQGGGFVVSYLYVWFGYLGVILVAIILGKIIISLGKSNNQYYLSGSIILFSMFPRWLAYEPIHLIKMPIYTIVICFIMNIINTIINKERKTS